MSLIFQIDIIGMTSDDEQDFSLLHIERNCSQNDYANLLDKHTYIGITYAFYSPAKE